MKKNIIRIYLTIILAFLSGHWMYSQQNILYFMNGIHQSSELNPAYQNPCNGYLALPAISGININVTNTGFTYNDLIRPGTGLQKDSLVVDIDNIKGKLGKNNYLRPEINISLFGLGFWIRDYYFTFSISNKTKSYFAYTDDLVKITDGNSNYIGESNPITLSGLGPHAINYNEIALGLSKQLTNKLTVGARMKILMGTAAISKQKSDLKLYTADVDNNYALRLETDIKFNVSGPINVKKDKNDKIEEIEFDNDEIISSAFSTKNMGLAFDLGATYQLNDKIKLYASLTDLGFIRWGNNTYNFYQKGTFNFEGVKLDSVWTNSDYDLVKEMTDSISDFFEVNESHNKFTTWLNTNIYIGATYELTKGINLGLLSQTVFYNKKIHQGMILSANFEPISWFSASLSYSMINRSYANFGLGLAVKLGGTQLYILTDYLNSLKLKDTKSIGIQLGVNIYFGCKKRNKYPVFGGGEHSAVKCADF